MKLIGRIVGRLMGRKWRNRRDFLNFEREWEDKFVAEQTKENLGKDARYIEDLKRHTVTWDEWRHTYHFPNLSEEEKQSYVSVFELQRWYRQYNNRNLRNQFYDKAIFLNHYRPHIKRRFLLPNEANEPDFMNRLKDLAESHDLIVKDATNSRGEGIEKVKKGTITDYGAFRERIVSKGLVVEECLTAHPEIAKFNPSALSTLRIMTAHNGGEPKVYGAFIRFALKDAIVDNAHGRGGLLALIDPETGIISSDAYRIGNTPLEFHPKTGHKFKGTVIPYWKEAVEKALSLQREVPLPFIGWDIAVTADGTIDIIEGNHAADADGMQLEHGRREEFAEQFHKFHHWLEANGKIVEYPYAGIKFPS